MNVSPVAPVRKSLTLAAATDAVPQGPSSVPAPTLPPSPRRAPRTGIQLPEPACPKAARHYHERLRAATRFGVFVSGNFSSGYSDVEGNLAAGGKVHVWHYSIGQRQRGIDIVAPGGVQRGVPQSRGDIGRRGEGTTAAGRAITGSAANKAVNFTEIAMDLGYATLEMAQLRTNGVAVGTQRLTLTGSNPQRNVFQLSASAVAGAREIVIDVPEGAETIINVAGSDVRFTHMALRHSSGGMNLDSQSEAARSAGRRTWINLPDATSLRLDHIGGGSTEAGNAWRANLLAPHAAVDFDSGLMAGHLFARSFDGEGLFDYEDALLKQRGVPPSKPDYTDGQINYEPAWLPAIDGECR